MSFWLVVGWQAALKIYTIFLKYYAFEGVFLHIFMGKTNTKLEFLHIAVSKNIKHKSEKTVNFCFKVYVLGLH